MKFLSQGLVALTGLGLLASSAEAAMKASPVQTFFVPIPEYEVMYQSFVSVRKDSYGPITSIVSFSVSTDGTQIWYDHWEDGYDEDVTDSSTASPTTLVWGDGNITNGCAPGTPCNKDSDDVLKAGQSIVIENYIPVSYKKDKKNVPSNRNSLSSPDILFDGRDRIQASFFIAITRGAYPEHPGAYLAGAVEVVDTDGWGTEFEAPVGAVMNSNSDRTRREAYELTMMYVMAGEDDTKVTYNSTTIDLQMGESFGIPVNQGDVVTSNKKIQADIIAMDLNSRHEIRWYSLVAREFWSNKYMSPMGDSTTKTKVVLYNPNNNQITIKVDRPNGKTDNIQVSGKSSMMTKAIETGDGVVVSSGSKFTAQSMTDTVSGGNNNDWGFPLVPYDLLTHQVLIGWGYGCAGKTCSGTNRQGNKGSRSVVYVACVDDCDIYVDTDNSGTHDLDFKNVKAIQSKIITDEKDHDMSGAVIWATKPGTGPTGAGVNIASAWGQDPARSRGGDLEALDLGTVVLPFNPVKVTELVRLYDDVDKDGVISPGDILEYTIRVQNNGQIDILRGDFTITGPILALALTQRQYVKGTCKYDNKKGKTSKCGDNTLGSAGLPNMYDLPKQGGEHDITFRAKIDDITKVLKRDLPNNGLLKDKRRGTLPFSVQSVVVFDPKVEMIKTVHLGDVDCTLVTKGINYDDAKLVKGVQDSVVTYCYTAVNNGRTFLRLRKITDPDINYTKLTSAVLPLKGKAVFKTLGKIGAGPFSSTASVAANPIYANNQPIPDLDDVTDDDTAGVDTILFDADVKIEKTVHLNTLDTCSDGDNLVTGVKDTAVTYCYKITNTGATTLTNFVVTDLGTGLRTTYDQKLEPGEFFFRRRPTKITTTMLSDGIVEAKVSYTDGTLIPGQPPVTDKDPAGVRMIEKQIFTCPAHGQVKWASGTPKPLTLLQSITAAPTLSPTPAPTAAPVVTSYTVASMDFATSADMAGWTFKPNAFKNTKTQTDLSYGMYNATSKALHITIGRNCKNSKYTCNDRVNEPMSAALEYKFKLKDAGKLTISYRLRGWTHIKNDNGEDGIGYLSLDGNIVRQGTDEKTIFLDSVSRGKTHEYYDWRTVTRTISAGKGDHTLAIGGLFTSRTTREEQVVFEFDDVKIEFSP